MKNKSADNSSTYTTTTANTVPQLTMAELESTMQMLRDMMQPEPIGEWMRAEDRPPERWRVVLPQKLHNESDWPMLWPDYVTFSPLLDKPVFTPRVL